jgi:hypothetical protein
VAAVQVQVMREAISSRPGRSPATAKTLASPSTAAAPGSRCSATTAVRCVMAKGATATTVCVYYWCVLNRKRRDRGVQQQQQQNGRRQRESLQLVHAAVAAVTRYHSITRRLRTPFPPLAPPPTPSPLSTLNRNIMLMRICTCACVCVCARARPHRDI